MLLLPVQYSSTYPDLDVYKKTNRERLEGQLLTKASDWAYEQESRVLLQNGPDIRVGIPYDLVRRVILGCRVSDADKGRLITILQKRRDKPPLFQATKSETSFSLTFSQINYWRRQTNA